MKVSVCIITKNEEAKLRKCLESVKPFGFEIVVVDTGSTDGTKKIMETYADVMGEFEWCNDFAKARNYSMELAHNDLILVLDSDEWMEQGDVEELERSLTNRANQIGRIERINDMVTDGTLEKGHERISRFFDRRFFEYRGRIHEQVCSKNGLQTTLTDVPITIGHSGYIGTDEEKRAKAARNIHLLELDLEEYGKDPYILYQLGKSYFMQKDYDKAAVYFEEALDFDVNPQLEYIQDLVETYGYTLLQLKRFEDMMFLEGVYKEFAISADYVFLMGLAYMNNARFKEAIAEFEKATTFRYCKVEGCNSFKAYYNAGVIKECLGDKASAGAYYEKCGDYKPAQDGLMRLGM